MTKYQWRWKAPLLAAFITGALVITLQEVSNKEDLFWALILNLFVMVPVVLGIMLYCACRDAKAYGRMRSTLIYVVYCSIVTTLIYLSSARSVDGAARVLTWLIASMFVPAAFVAILVLVIRDRPA